MVTGQLLLILIYFLMTKTIEITRPKFEISTLEVFSQELFNIHSLPQVQEDLDKLFKLAMLTSEDEFSLLDKQTVWETIKLLKTTVTSFQTNAHPETVFELTINL